MTGVNSEFDSRSGSPHISAEESVVLRSGSLRDAVLLRWRSMRTGRTSLARRLTIALMVAAALAATLTFLVLTRTVGLAVSQEASLILIVVDLVLALSLGAVIAWGVVRLWAQRRAGTAGARLHIRLVTLFALVAIAPAIIIVFLSAAFFNLQVQSWFNERVQTAVENSVVVADAYLNEHRRVIAADALAMAHDLNRQLPSLLADPAAADRMVQLQASLRSLSEVLVFDQGGRILARAGLTFSLEFERPPFWAIEQASRGEVSILTSDSDDRVRAMVELDSVPPTYLYVGRFVDANVLRYVERTRTAASEYKQAETRREDLQLTLAMIFVIVTLLLLLSAVGVGLGFANRLTRPIARLVHAAEMVRSGNLEVRVDEANATDEFGVLTRSFNRMTRQLEEQRRELTEANRQLEDRRRFTEAVLAGVSAGVLALDRNGRVNLPNRSATSLLGEPMAPLIGRPLAEAVPAMAPLVTRAMAHPDRLVEDDITVKTDGETLTLHVRIAAERATSGEVIGFVVTFDDMTDLLAAQRKAAWVDVARRIAHEIKNPLTPIQLSAERLKRRYLRQISDDADTFEQCTDTIVRHVDDIGRMVDEFSAFARMPNPVLTDADLGAICRDAVFLQKTAHSGVQFRLEVPEGAVMAHCDPGLVTQAVTNLLLNAVEAIEGRDEAKRAAETGEVWVSIAESQDELRIVVEDNGIGLPDELRERLTEPYVTTREKGTGLGLAIVARVMEQHGGMLELTDRSRSEKEPGGACAMLVFPRTGADGTSAREND